MDYHEIAGIALKLTEVPVAPLYANSIILDRNICSPKLKYGLKVAAFFLVYKVPKAHVKVEIKEIIIPNLKLGIKKSLKWS